MTIIDQLIEPNPDGRKKSVDAKRGPLSLAAMEAWLWEAACVIRGATDAPKFKDFILPLVFYKRLSDVFDDEIATRAADFGDEATAREVIEADHADALRSGRRPIVRFMVPSAVRWSELRNHSGGGALGEFVTTAMRKTAAMNPLLKGVIDNKDFNERQSGQRTLDDDRLALLIEVINRHRIGLSDAEPDVLGRAYEYLLRKFAEGAAQSAGEFYTPTEVAALIAKIIEAPAYSTIYDPTCGSGGLLINARLEFVARNPSQRSQAPKVFGQELNPDTFAMAKMNMFLHDFMDAEFAIGDTLTKPGLATQSMGLRKFDFVVANPMWNQKGYSESFYENDGYGRFSRGTPPKRTADWGWAQHILASLKEDGRAAIVLDTGSVARGSTSQSGKRELKIRQRFIADDLVEAVIELPENLFYNTPAAGIILVLNNKKPTARQGSILLVNASKLFITRKPKNILSAEGIAAITNVFARWSASPKLSVIMSCKELHAADDNILPSHYIHVNEELEYRTIPDILADIAAADSHRRKVDKRLSVLLESLGERQESNGKTHGV